MVIYNPLVKTDWPVLRLTYVKRSSGSGFIQPRPMMASAPINNHLPLQFRILCLFLIPKGLCFLELF